MTDRFLLWASLTFGLVGWLVAGILAFAPDRPSPMAADLAKLRTITADLARSRDRLRALRK